MNRNEFIKIVWKKGFIPLLLLAIVCLIASIIQNGGIKDSLTIWTIVFLLLLIIIEFIFKKIRIKINSKLSYSLVLRFNIMWKVIKYLIIFFIYGLFIHHFWSKEWFILAIITGIPLIIKTIETYRQLRQSFHQIVRI